jgi:Holliday junction DNA helicase RuvA
MYEYIKGKLIECTALFAVIDNAGIGFKFFVPAHYAQKLSPNDDELKLYVSPVIRENSHSFYGFLSREERETFEVLIDISGIGPKTALGILSAFTPSDLAQAINSEDTLAISKVPGIGKKTSERLIIDMRGKLKSLLQWEEEASGLCQKAGSQRESDAMSALVNLGYGHVLATKAVQKILKDKPELELAPLITEALRSI